MSGHKANSMCPSFPTLKGSDDISPAPHAGTSHMIQFKTEECIDVTDLTYLWSTVTYISYVDAKTCIF